MNSSPQCRLLAWTVTMLTSLWILATASMSYAQYPDAPMRPETREQFHRDVEAVRDELGQPSWSDPTRHALALRVQAFLGERLMAAPAGDERQTGFSQQLNQTYQLFTLALQKLDRSSMRSLDLTEFENVSFEAYTQNFPQFAEYFKRSYVLSRVDQPTFLATMLAFSMTVYAFDRAQWRQAQAFSHVWPLCRKRSSS